MTKVGPVAVPLYVIAHLVPFSNGTRVSAAVRVTSNLPLEDARTSGCWLMMDLPTGNCVLPGAQALSSIAAAARILVARRDF